MVTKNKPKNETKPVIREGEVRVLKSVEDIEQFQKIIQLLVDFDSKTGRFKRYNNPEKHYLRSAVGVCMAQSLKVTLKHLGGWVYDVTAEHPDFKTEWAHEDGIKQERETSGKEHPVHQIVCVTDLFERGEPA